MIELAIIIAFTVLFIQKTTDDGMIFAKVKDLLYDLPEWIKKPLFGCPICMAPWWGSLILMIGVIDNAWQVRSVFEWVMIIFIAAGINTTIVAMSRHDEIEIIERPDINIKFNDEDD